jgi:hypothetical protein
MATVNRLGFKSEMILPEMKSTKIRSRPNKSMDNYPGMMNYLQAIFYQIGYQALVGDQSKSFI